MSKICQMCGGETRLWGVTDFNRCCNDVFEQRRMFPISPEHVSYYKCTRCGLLDTSYFDSWNLERFSSAIYNDEYIKTDPPFEEDRPQKMSVFLNNFLAAFKDHSSLLDFGGGAGTLAKKLARQGFQNVSSYDPIYDAQSKPVGTFDFVTAFEVVEHVPDQKALLKEIASFCHDETVFLFTTELQPGNIEQIGMSWWYIAPRNGHIVFHTAESLKLWGAAEGFTVHSFGPELHMAYRAESDKTRSLLRQPGSKFRVNDVPPSQHKENYAA